MTGEGKRRAPLFYVLTSREVRKSRFLAGRHITFWIYSAISLLAFVMVLTMVPETKGRSLEQIEAYWEGLSQVRR